MPNFTYDLRTVHSVSQLAVWLGVDNSLLTQLATPKKELRFYKKHAIPKKRRRVGEEYRIVWEAEDESIAQLHKHILRRCDLFLRRFVPGFPHESAYGYVKGRSTLQNAKQHCGDNLLLRADITDFFGTITRNRIADLLVQVGVPDGIASFLSQVITISDSLPLGLHSSPLWANLVCMKLDEDLFALAKDYSCVYTRYADDIAISGNTKVPSKVKISTILGHHGFRLSTHKFRVTKRGQAHFVTGLSVSESDRPRVPKWIKKRLRQEIYYAEKFGLRKHIGREMYSSFESGVNSIEGRIIYVRGIERELGESLANKWREILRRNKMAPSYLTRLATQRRRVQFLIDESEIPTSAGTVLALGCIVSADWKYLHQVTKQMIADELADPFQPGKRTALIKKGMHYVDLHPDLRTKYVEKLFAFPFRGFIAYQILKNNDEYENTYIELLQSLLLGRFSRYDRAEVYIVLEENSKISHATVESLVTDIYSTLEASNSRRPFTRPKVVQGKKPDFPELAVPDFLLGVFSDYALSEKDDKPISVIRFERLRDKYSLIQDRITGTFYSRKRPFAPWKAGVPAMLS